MVPNAPAAAVATRCNAQRSACRTRAGTAHNHGVSSFDDVLVFATATLALAAATFTAFGLRRQRHGGWLWWTAALWLTTLGTGIAATRPGPVGAALLAPLVLQWPLLTLVGLRRFHARQAWLGSQRLDLVILAGTSAGAVIGSWLPELAILGFCSALAAHLYPAWVLFALPGDRDHTPLYGLAATMALVSFAPGLATLFEPSPMPHAPVLAAALGVIVLAFIAQTLHFERTERQLRDSRRRLRTLANMDSLTQVPNRRHFSELTLLALARDPAGSAMLLLFDIDHFKQINDRLGHAAGDRALRLVSRSVQEHLRAPDVVGRHGGDEFVLLLRGAGKREALGVAARIVAEVQRRTDEHQLPRLSLSFGLVQIGPDEDLDQAMRRADQALYEAKRQGRSRAVAADGDESQPNFSESQRLGLTAS